MNDASDATKSFLTDPEEIDRLADQFEAEYRSGKRPRIEDVIKEYAGDRVQLLRELLTVELEFRQKSGDLFLPEEYCRRFPDSQAVIRSVFADLDHTCIAPVASRPATFPREFGDYRLIRRIGEGGMGVVYEAEQKSLGNRRLALKTIKYVGELDDRALKRFRTEIEAIAQLEHRHIVPVYHVGQESGVHYYVMKFIEGNDLRQLVKTLKSAVSRRRATTDVRSGTERDTSERKDSVPSTTHHSGWSKGDTLASNELLERISQEGTTAHPKFVREFARLGIQVAEALHHVHQQGIVHRDIKPANLLLDVDGDVWLTDFGLAMIRDKPDLTAPGTLVGTYHYMSPEQAMGSKRVIVDHRTDIYSLGVTLYELLTLRRAFPGSSREEILRSVQFDSPAPVRKLAPRVPVDLETIVMKAMAKDPNARFQSAAEMAAELQRFLDGKPLTIRPPSVLERFGYWARANRQAVAALAAVCVITFLASIASSLFFMQMQSVTQSALVMQEEQNAEIRKQKNEVEKQRDQVEKQKNQVEAERDKVNDLLEVSEGLRLAANSLLQVENDPELSLRLAIEAAERYASADAHDGIVRALDVSRTARTLQRSTVANGGDAFIHSHASFNQDGTKLVSSATTRSPSGAGTTDRSEPAIVWDTKSGKVLGRLNAEKTVTSAVFSPDDGLVLTACGPPQGFGVMGAEIAAVQGLDDSALGAPVLWNATTYQPFHTFEDAYLYRAHRSVFSPDGLRVVLPVRGNQAAVFFYTGRRLVSFIGHEAAVVFAAFSPDGDRVVTCSDDNTVRIWDAETGEQRLLLDHWRRTDSEQQPRDLTWVEFTPDGRRLVTGAMSSGIEVWDLEKQGERINVDRVPGISGDIYGNGDLLATRGGEDGKTMTELAIRSAYDAHWIGKVVINKFLRKVVVSPDSRVAAVLYLDAMNSFQIWDLERHELLGTCEVGAEVVQDLVFSPDSKMIATPCIPVMDPKQVKIRLWHVHNGRERATFPVRSSIGHPLTAYHPDGSNLAIVAAEADPIGVLCDFTQAKQRMTLDAKLAVPDRGGKRFLVAGNQRMAIHSMDDGRFLEMEAFLHGDPKEIAIDRDGDRVAAYCGAPNVWLWDPDNNHRLLLSAGNSEVNKLSFSPDGDRLFALSSDGNVRVWDANEGTLIQKIQTGGRLVDIDFSPDGKRFAVAAYRDAATLYDAETFEVMRRFRLRQAEASAGVSFDRVRFTFDGNGLFTFRSMQSKSIVLWDVGSGEQRAELEVAGSVGLDVHPSQPEVLVWSTREGALIWRYEQEDGQRVPVTDARTTSGAYSTDGQAFYLGTSGSRISESPRLEDWPVETKPSKVTRWIREGTQSQESIAFPLAVVSQIVVGDPNQVFVNAYHINQVVNVDVDSHSAISTIAGHDGPVSQCLYWSDSNLLITTSWDGKISFWNVADGSLAYQWSHGSSILAAAMSRDGKFLVTGARDGSCRIWDLQASTEQEPVSQSVSLGDSPLSLVAFAPDASQVLTLSSDHHAHLIRRENGEKVAVEVGAERIEWAEISPDGKWLLAIPRIEGGNPRAKEVLIVPLAGGEVRRLEYPQRVSTSHFHPDSQRLVTTIHGGEETAAWIQNVSSGHVERKIPLGPGGGQYAVFDPTGEFVFVSEFNAGTIWRVVDGRRWLTVEDANVDSAWRHRVNPFVPSQPRRVLTRRFDTFQFRETPLEPLEVTRNLTPRPLTEVEESRFLLGHLRPETPPSE